MEDTDHPMAPAMLPVLAERDYRQTVTSQPGWFDRDTGPGASFVRFTFEPDGSVTVTRMDAHGRWMAYPETIPEGTPAEKITARLAALETMTEDHRECCGPAEG